MVWYPLDWCQRMGIHDITLITPPDAAPPLETALKTHPALTGFRVDVLSPQELTQTTGTGELLRLPEVQSAITGDFVILPCDLVSELDGSKLVQQWLTLNPSSPSKASSRRKGGLALYYPTHGREGISAKKDETDFLASVPLPAPTVPAPAGSLREGVEEVVTVMPTDTLNDTLEESKGVLPVRHTLLKRHKRVKMRTKHRDAHVYVFPHWVKEFAAKNERFDSISEDVLGWWAKAGWQDGLAEKLGMDEVLAEKREKDDETNGSLEDEEVDAMALSSTKAAPPVKVSETTFATRVGDSAPGPKRSTVVPPLLAYVQPAVPSQPLVRRCDTAPQLASISLYIARQAPEHILGHEHKVHPTASIGMQSRISQEDCLIAENVTMGIRCNVKESVVGPNCAIGSNVRLTKCVLMDGVVVGDGVTLTGCIVGRRARIEGVAKPADAPVGTGEEGATGAKKGKKKAAETEEDQRTKLTECEVAPYFVVEAGTEAKGETLKGFDTAEGLEEDEEMDEADVGEDDD